MSRSLTFNGVYPYTGALLFQAGAPLDTRFVVKTEQHLMDKDVWYADGNLVMYDGLPVYVSDTKSWYIMTNTALFAQYVNAYNEKHSFDTYYALELLAVWTKISTADDLKNLGGVFKFQGVASAIDADHCTLTIGAATKQEDSITTTDKEGKETTGSLEVSYKVTNYKVDIEGDTYFLWTSTATGALEYWTRGDFVNGAKTYNKSELLVKTFVYQEDTYYGTEEKSEDNSKTKYMTLDEDVLWVDNEGYIYETSASTTKLQDTPVSIAAAENIFFFTDANNPLANVTKSGKPEQATESNKGHVYQLGDEEYASNGTIWVQLGSPKEDWIVIK